MPKVRFVGRLFPSAVRLSVASAPTVEWPDRDRDLSMRFSLSIQDNKIGVDCELNRWLEDDLVHVHNRALDLIKAAVDLAGFSMGVGFTVVLEKFVRPDGAETDISTQDESLASLCKSFDMGDAAKFEPMLKMAIENPAIMIALNELSVAIAIPHHAPVNCARAIEGLRRIIASPSANDSTAWEEFRKALRLEKSYILPITDVSRGPRHGDRQHIPGPKVTEATRRAWVIMDRFLALKILAISELPASEFVILS